MPLANYGAPSTDSGGTTSGGGFTDRWWEQPIAPLPSFTSAPSGPSLSDVSTGRFSINVASPGGLVGSLQENQEQANDFISGIGEALFGERTGLISGIPLVGPLIGAGVRGISSLPPVQWAAAAPGAVFGAAETILSRIPTGWLPGGVDEMWARLPDSEEKRVVEQAANADILYGANMKYDYLQKFAAESADRLRTGGSLATLAPELSAGVAGSAGGLLVQVLQTLGLAGTVTRRLIAGSEARPGGARLDEIARIAAESPVELTPVEAKTVEMLGTGQWDEGRALDYLASHGGGLSHDPLLDIAGSFITDPAVLAGFGSGLLTKAAQGARLAAEAGKVAGPIGRIAVAAQDSAVGPLFKIARSVVDPLSALGNGRISPQVVDVTSAQWRSMASNLMFGEGNLVAARNALDPLGLTDRVFVDASGALDNISREHVGSSIGDNLRTVGPAAFGPEFTSQGLPSEAIEAGLRGMTKDNAQRLIDRLTRVRESNVNVADLTERLAVAYGKTADDYKALVDGLSDDARAFLHLATYNAAENRLMEAVAKSVQVADQLPLARMVVANPRHLDEEAAALLRNSLEGAKTKAGKAGVLQRAIERYDNITGIIRYDPNDIAGSTERAIEKLDELVSRKHLYRIARADEIAKYPELQAWADTHKSWKIAFRPADENLWLLIRDSEGNPVIANPWVGHAPNDGRSMALPGVNLPRNLVGMPVAGPIARAARRPVDWIESGLNALRPQVSGQVARSNARMRFDRIGAQRFGLSESESHQIWDAIALKAQADDWSQSVRGLSGRSMWKAITEDASLIPTRLQRGKGHFTQRDLTHLVLEAWEGDLRYVGLTQKFTGRMKTLLGTKGPLAEFAGGNFAGQVSEKLYPMVRFQFHPLFQAQEAVEGIILNAQRGVRPFIRGKMSARDQEIARIMQNLQDKGLVRLFEMGDQAEFSAISQAGGQIAKAIGDLPNAGVSLSETGGLKFIARQKYINYLRLWGSMLGKPVRQALGEERWLALKGHYGIADDNDMAVRYLTEMMSETMDVSLRKDGFLNYKDSIARADMWKSGSIGSFRPLDLDFLARDLGYKHMAGLRQALDDGRQSMDSIIEALRDNWGASDEYLNRATLALRFNVNDFWSNVRGAYNLTDKELGQIRGSFDAAARLRGLSPAEYLSGVVAPQIAKKTAAEMAKAQEIKNTVALLRAPKGVPKYIKGPAGDPVRVSQADTLYAELAAAFKPHLDPSGVDVLRKASGIKGRWGAAHNKWLGEQMRAYLDGAVPANVDVERALQFMGRWTNDAGAALDVGSPEFRAIMEKTRKLDTSAGVPYNLTEHLLFDSVIDRIKSLEQDAYRVHYFKRARTVLERSVNHPFFGLYPASYMWGKILPEIIRFVAKEPFGIPTGALAYGSNDVYQSIAMQRELDEEFDKELDRIGRSPAAFMLGYFLPAVPWDVPAVLPGWLREIANQGQKNVIRRERGDQPVNINVGRAADVVGNYLSPIGQDIDRTNSILKQLGDLVQGTPKEQTQRGGPQVTVPGINQPIGGSNLAPELATIAEQLNAQFTNRQ